jgi:SAM-dependent methyltransferase
MSVAALQSYFYPHLKGRWDDDAFRAALIPHVQGATVLDLGAGRGFVPHMNFRDVAGLVCGVDPDNAVLRNPYLHQAKIGTAESIPYPTNSFDVVFSNNVLEHLPDPLAALKEIGRVLRPGGRFLFKTPNRFHYVALISSLTPHWFHQLFYRFHGTAPEDVFPTLYRANSPRSIRKLAADSGLACESLSAIEGRPEYLRLTVPTYLAGVLYERLVNSSDLLSGLRCVIIGCLKHHCPMQM